MIVSREDARRSGSRASLARALGISAWSGVGVLLGVDAAKVDSVRGPLAVASMVILTALTAIVALAFRSGRAGLTGLCFLWIGFVATAAVSLGARSPDMRSNERDALGTIRVLQSSEVAYASSNSGAFGSISCLASPTACGFEPGTTSFIDSQLAALAPSMGYARSFVPGAPAVGSPDRHGIRTFAVTAVPVKPGETGRRGFCGDDTGVVYYTTDGSAPAVQDGRCVPIDKRLR